MNFLQRYLAKPASEIERPAVEPSSEETKPEPVDAILPIRVDEAQYFELTRALRPAVEPVLKDLMAGSPGLDVPIASPPTPASPRAGAPEQPPGTPIV